jgi:diguanylate cyclase (GGDEF)-like protein
VSGEPQADRSVLLIDDSVDIHLLIDAHLQKLQVTLAHAYSGAEGLAVALRVRPDLILLDYHMADLDGIAVLKRLRNDANYAALATTPVILVTGSDAPDLINTAFECGAADYVRKPIRACELRARVEACLRSQGLLRELYCRAMLDELTELPNRAYLLDAINDLLQVPSSGAGEPFALLVLNLDRFKLVNESLGYAAGGRLLREVARRIGLSVERLSRDTGVGSPLVARIGGDEFAILLRASHTQAGLEAVAEDLLQTLTEKFVQQGRVLYPGASLGIARNNGHHQHAEELLRDADTAMNAAKKAGRGRYRIFSQSMRAQADALLQLDSDLRQAIEDNQFLLLYQPILDLRTGHVASVEALVRWNQPRRGWISPVEFIPAAEETGLIIDLGEWILRTACNQLMRWTQEAPQAAPPVVNVNVSREQLLHPHFSQMVRQVLQETGLPAQRLALEVTESCVMSDVSTSVATLNELSQMGCGIHLDDFGTGYSSLSCLVDFPIDTLKIDRSLIKSLTEHNFGSSLVKFVLQLAGAMNIEVVAEGIEYLGQALRLEGWGCRYGQGFYFAKPLQAEFVLGYVAGSRCVHYADVDATAGIGAEPVSGLAEPQSPIVAPFSHFTDSVHSWPDVSPQD